MRRTRGWLFGLLAVVLLLSAAVPSWAYTISVTNETGYMIIYDVDWGLINSHRAELTNGRTDTYSNDDWKNKGLCWEHLQFRHQIPGCFDSPHTVFTFKCGDTHVLIRRGNEECTFDISY